MHICMQADDSDTLCEDTFQEHAALLTQIWEKASLKARKADQQMIARHSTKNPPSIFAVGDEVLVQFDSKIYIYACMCAYN